MGKRDKRIDAYIAKSAPFAQPILNHLRELIHATIPEVVEDTKWGFPHFDYKGVFCSMAAFKAHCSFGFWKSALMKDPKKIMSGHGENGMGSFGKITSLEDLPSDRVMISFLKEAQRLNDEGIKLEKPTRKKNTKPLAVPASLLSALNKNKKALKVWEAFSPSRKKEYAEWIADAKTEATQLKRLEQAIEWIAEGKSRHWKYQ